MVSQLLSTNLPKLSQTLRKHFWRLLLTVMRRTDCQDLVLRTASFSTRSNSTDCLRGFHLPKSINELTYELSIFSSFGRRVPPVPKPQQRRVELGQPRRAGAVPRRRQRLPGRRSTSGRPRSIPRYGIAVHLSLSHSLHSLILHTTSSCSSHLASRWLFAAKVPQPASVWLVAPY